uniref:UBC core domain-containing protein n=1 Tax=Trichobilharzia regenti TaxID=157069 RepID=A0AA85ITJ1_TRIRE|nr:unnamed protein product [Trichobilharzia regenti]
MFHQGYHILAELSLLKFRHPSGVFIRPNEDNLLKWVGLISVRSGYYFGGVFSFILILPDDFPSTKVPKIYLPKGFYHPHVDCITGEVNVYSEFPVWNPNKYHIWHLLHYFKRMLTSPTSIMVSSLVDQTACIRDMREVKYANTEAANALIHHPEEFDTQVKCCVSKLSVWSGSAQDIPTLNVSGWTNDNLLNDARNLLEVWENSKHDEENTVISQGFSWIDPKSMSIFSNESAIVSETSLNS